MFWSVDSYTGKENTEDMCLFNCIGTSAFSINCNYAKRERKKEREREKETLNYRFSSGGYPLLFGRFDDDK